MTQETPAKVFSLLGVALTSMFFLFAVSATNASFQRADSFPDPFAPTKVVAVLDDAASGYSQYVYQVLVQPGAADFKLAADNLAFVGQEAGPQLAAMLGFSGQQASSVPMVAGAFTQKPASSDNSSSRGGWISMDTLYSLLIH